MRNILFLTLSELGVSHTHSYTDRLFAENPDRDNLFGLSSMLAVYGVRAKGYRVSDKTDLSGLDCPFIALLSQGFALVTEIDTDDVCVSTPQSKRKMSRLDFIEDWSGIMLGLNKSDDAEEPDYAKHKKEERSNCLKTAVATALPIAFLLVMVCVQDVYFGLFPIILWLMTDFAGLAVSILLVFSQLNINTGISDSVCSFFGTASCSGI